MKNYSISIRVLSCEKCTQPVEVAISGGTVTCNKCNHTNIFPPRPDPILPVQFSSQFINEDERLNRLKAQDGKPLLPPEGLKGLFERGRIPEWKVEEAKIVWLSKRKEVYTTGNFEAAESLFFLTFVFSNRLRGRSMALAKRSMFESALEAFKIPRHRQIMFCNLSAGAAREFDQRSAREWIDYCDPHSGDIQADTHYRYAKTLIATSVSNWSEVIKTLGENYNQIPIMDAYDGVCAVLRANAIEKQGNVELAKEQLITFMNDCGASGQALVSKIIGNYKDWNLCPQSFAIADVEYTKKAAKSMGGIGGIGKFLMGMAIIMFLSGITVIVSAVFKINYPLIGIPPMDTIGGMIMMSVMSLLPFGFGFSMWKGAKKNQYLRLNGIRAIGKIIKMTTTGTRINKVPQYKLTLTVNIENKNPYEATTKVLLRSTDVTVIKPGATVNIRVNPKNPKETMLETV